MSRTNRGTLALVFILLSGVPIVAGAKQPNGRGLQDRLRLLEAENATLHARLAALEEALVQVQAIVQFVRVEPGPINGLSGPHWIIEGANVHVRSGSGETSDGCGVGPTAPPCGSLTGLGNLVVGYNDAFPPPRGGGGRISVDAPDRTT